MKTFLRKLIGWLFRLLWNIEIYGEENLPPSEPMVIVANHSHMLDPFLISTVFPYNATAMAKAELFKNPILRVLLYALDAEPVDRDASDIRAIRRSIEILKEQSLVIFSEGTRNRTGFQLEAKPGATLIANKAGVRILPITIAGSFKPFTTLKLFYHPVVRIEDFGYEKYNSETYTQISNDIMSQIYETFRENMDYAVKIS